MRTLQDSLITTATSLAATWTSEAIDVTHVSQAAISLVYTGTPAGDFFIEVSCDESRPDMGATANASQVTTWHSLASKAVAVNAAGSSLVELADMGYTWLRVRWAPDAADAGFLTVAKISAKGV